MAEIIIADELRPNIQQLLRFGENRENDTSAHGTSLPRLVVILTITTMSEKGRSLPAA